jgi:hypothetical protein
MLNFIDTDYFLVPTPNCESVPSPCWDRSLPARKLAHLNLTFLAIDGGIGKVF